MKRRCTVVILTVGLCVSILLAKPGIVKTKDGRTFEGDVTETVERPDEVEVGVKGGSLTVKRADIASIEYTGDIEQQYQQRLARLGPSPKASDHLTLARWLFDQKAYDLAVVEVQKAQALEPGNNDATMMLATIQRQRKMDNKAAAGTNPAVENPKQPGGNGGIKAPVPRKLLTPDQIQVIKRSELREDDNGIRVVFTNDVLKKFADKVGGIAMPDGSIVKINELDDFQKTLAIFSRAPDMKDMVKIVNDPAAIADYKRIHPMILASCATAGCHNETSKSSFILFNGTDNETAYTDFFILTQWGNKGQNKLVDRVRPKSSLLLNYGLQRDRTTMPHKDVFGFRASFVNDQSPPYQSVLNWISGSLSTVEPVYALDYQLPTGVPPKPTTQAATVPATKPDAAAPKPDPAPAGPAIPATAPAAPATQPASQAAPGS